MVKRRRIGILHSYDDNWAGGLHYILNIIKALKTLQDDQKPFLIIFYGHDISLDNIKELDYPYIEFLSASRPLSAFGKVLNRLLKLFIGKNLLFRYYDNEIVDFLFPFHYDARFESLSRLNSIYWIPDFQHKHLPDLFTKEQLRIREKTITDISRKKNLLILSSESALNDYKSFYPNYANRVKVMRFASVVPELNKIDLSSILKKYKIESNYFIVSNQFWKHKNHMVVLKAIEILARQNETIKVIFTGKNTGNCKLYFNQLSNYSKQKMLDPYISFLGFISRIDQLVLMKMATAVIQPSMFEGWSTVVEDAKALRKYLIVSDIPVHREQLKTCCGFFTPSDHGQLAMKMKEILHGETDIKCGTNNYRSNVKQYAEELLKLDEY